MNADIELPIGVLAGPDLEEAARELARQKAAERLLDLAIAEKVIERVVMPAPQPEFAI